MAVIKNFRQPPSAPHPDIAREFAQEMYAARVDPSDKDECCQFLVELHPDRLRQIIDHFELACYELDQMHIEAEMARMAS